MSVPLKIPPAPSIPPNWHECDKNGWIIIHSVKDLPPLNKNVLVWTFHGAQISCLTRRLNDHYGEVGWTGEYFKHRIVGVVYAWKDIDIVPPAHIKESGRVDAALFSNAFLKIDGEGNFIK